MKLDPRSFSAEVVANSKIHQKWWSELSVNRRHFHNTEDYYASLSNGAAILPRDAWQDLDATTVRVMRADEGEAWMRYLMPLAKSVNVGKLVHLYRTSSDLANPVNRSMSGQVPQALDKVQYTYAGAPVPIFTHGYGREWREMETLRSEGFDALSDDQEASAAKIKRDMALYCLDGDATISVKGYKSYGIRTHPNSKTINVGPSGANIDLTSTSTTATAIVNFFSQTVGAAMDSNYINEKIVVFVSPQIFRNLDRPISDGAGLVLGTIREQVLKGSRVAAIEETFELTGNSFFAFVPNPKYIQPIVGMAVGTTAMPRQYPMANFQFLLAGAMGLQIKVDANNRGAVFYSIST